MQRRRVEARAACTLAAPRRPATRRRRRRTSGSTCSRRASASPYTVTIAQTLNGNHTIFYNQAGDSSGTITISSLQSVARAAAARRCGAVRKRCAASSASRGAGVVSDQVLVRYRSAGTTAQTRARASQIELAQGATAGPEITTVAGEYERFVHVPAGTDATAFASDAALAARCGRRLSGAQAVRAEQAGDGGERPAREQRRSVVSVRRRLPQRVVVHARGRHQDRHHRHGRRPAQHRSQQRLESRVLDRLRDDQPYRSRHQRTRHERDRHRRRDHQQRARASRAAATACSCMRTTCSPMRRRRATPRMRPFPTR